MAVTSSGTATVTLPTDEQILITREFDAPRHLVYKAWTTPELVKRWWNAKRGEVTVAEIDLRVGGTWRYVMVADGGFEVGFHGEYREIVPNERIVSTEVYEGMPEAEAVNTLTLTEADGRTTLTILVQHASKEHRDGHIDSGMEAGMQDAMDLLEQVASLASLSRRDANHGPPGDRSRWSADRASFGPEGSAAAPVRYGAICLRAARTSARSRVGGSSFVTEALQFPDTATLRLCRCAHWLLSLLSPSRCRQPLRTPPAPSGWRNAAASSSWQASC